MAYNVGGGGGGGGGGHLPHLNGWGIYDLKGGAVMKKYIAVSFGPKKMLVFGGVPFLIIA